MARLGQRWDLDAIFCGGSTSAQFYQFLKALEDKASGLAHEVKDLRGPCDCGGLSPLLERVQEISDDAYEARSFVRCLLAQDPGDTGTSGLNGRVTQVEALLKSIWARLDTLLAGFADAEWQGALLCDSLRPVAFVLDHRRRIATRRLSAREEEIIGTLAVHGFHPWSQVRSIAERRLRVEVEDSGTTRASTPGEITRMLEHPDPDVRRRAAQALQRGWAREANLCGLAINNLAGFRQNVSTWRGYSSVLEESLLDNRLSPTSLEAMWKSFRDGLPVLADHLNRRKEALNLPELNWYDLRARRATRQVFMEYDQAAEVLLDCFRRSCPGMAELTEKAFAAGWIDSEDRPGRRSGGFHAAFPRKGESRIFLTYRGRNSLRVLAHELGHAYHRQVTSDLPQMARTYPTCSAEVASMVMEMVLMSTMKHQTSDPQCELELADDELQLAMSCLMWSHSGFLFESRLYEERSNGFVHVDRLSELSSQSQREAYGGALSTADSAEWARTVHYYLSDRPFYSYPYAFGYLVGSVLCSRIEGQGSAFETTLRALLRDTGRMTMEDLIRKHLDEDLCSVSFWQRAMETVLNRL